MSIVNFPEDEGAPLIVLAYRIKELSERILTPEIRREIASRARVLAELAED